MSKQAIERRLKHLKKTARMFDYMLLESESLEPCVVIDIQNVDDYKNAVVDKELQDKKWGDHFPESEYWIDRLGLIKMPFQECFLEFYDSVLEKHFGVHCFEYDNYIATYWYESYPNHLDEFSQSIPYVRDICVDEKYTLIKTKDITNVYNGFVSDEVMTVLLAISFLNIRNVEYIDHEPSPEIAKAYKQAFGKGLVTYKTLRVKSTGKRLEADRDPKEYQGLMPLHLRRGNFAHYTDDKPLFGKYTGAFWRPATAVGEKKNGIVVKDYEVIPE